MNYGLGWAQGSIILVGGPQPLCEWAIFGGRTHPGMPDDTVASCAKMAEPLEMQFGVRWTEGNMRVLHGSTLAQFGEYN